MSSPTFFTTFTTKVIGLKSPWIGSTGAILLDDAILVATETFLGPLQAHVRIAVADGLTGLQRCI
jgi:hypothetical protein